MPSLTECLFALGAGDTVVACTRYCTDPPERVAALPKVGGTKTTDVAEIVALAPDLVIMNSEENRRADFDTLETAGITVFVTEPKTVEGALDLIPRLAAAAGPADEGRRMAEAQRARLVAALGERWTSPEAPAVPYFCPIWKKPWMAFNADTYAHDVLRLAGGANVTAGASDRYPRVTLEAIAAAEPEIVLLPDEPYPFADRDRDDLGALASTPAVRRGRVHLVDGKALAWFGPRTADGVLYFAEIFSRDRRDAARVTLTRRADRDT